MPAALARQRSQSRLSIGSSVQADRLDREDLAFYEKVRRGFLQRAELDQDRISIIDADRSIDETFSSVRAILADLCPEL